tara:strand:+ start:72 stop:317 length:246 start_codon:yes stop_codon:yes gene_type:complete
MLQKKLLLVIGRNTASQEKYTNKAKIPIDLATLRDFLFYLFFGLATSFLIVCIKFTYKSIFWQKFLDCFFRELLALKPYKT